MPLNNGSKGTTVRSGETGKTSGQGMCLGNGRGRITVEEAVVFEAAPAEQGVEGVEGLLPLD